MVPEWAVFMTPEGFEHFEGRLREALQRLDPEATFDAQSGTLQRSGDAAGRYSVVNLAQMCNQAPLDEWPSQIEHFLGALILRPWEGEGEEDRETVLQRLRVRLYSSELADGASMVKVNLAPGLMVALALDYPDRVATLGGGHARTLGRSREELFELGLAHVRATASPEVRRNRLKSGAELVSIASDDFFASSLALVVDEYVAPEPEAGYWVAVPNRHEALMVPLDHAPSVQALGPLTFMTRNLFERGPGSISPYVYWVRRRQWARVEVEAGTEAIRLVGPDPLLDAIEKLRP
jgi:hypothetical protein